MNLKFLMIAVLVAECFSAHSATVRLYFVDPLTNEKDTNAFYVTPIGTNVLSNGGVVGRGVTTRYVPASNGYKTNTLAVGHYSITNRSLGSGVVIRVPDSSSLYDYTNLLISGYNIFVTVTNGEGGGTSGALTNNETRAVTFESTLTIGGGSSQNPIAPSAGQLTFANSILVDGAFIQGRTIIGTNFVGNGDGLTNLPDVATQSGLAAGSYPIKVSALTSGNLTNFGFSVTNTTRGDAYRSFGLDTNGYFVSGYNNFDRIGDEPGYNFVDEDGVTIGTIGQWMDHGGSANTPEMIMSMNGNIAFLQARDGVANKNIQLGRNSYSSGFVNLGYGNANTPNGLSSISSGHSQRQVFPAIGPASNYAYPGMMGYWQSSSGGMNGYGVGGIKMFALVPLWTVGGNFSAYQGVETLDVSTNGIVAAASVSFKGNGSGVTNQNYALFTRQLAAGTTIPTVPSGAWTNVLFTTNSAGGTSFDSASGFTLSNSFIIVNAAGAGKWKARGRAVIYNNTDNTGAVLMALYRYSPSATELGYGDCVYQTGFTSPTAQLACTIDLVAGDVIGLRIFPAGSSNTQIGRSISAGIPFTVGALELERQ